MRGKQKYFPLIILHSFAKPTVLDSLQLMSYCCCVCRKYNLHDWTRGLSVEFFHAGIDM